MSIPTDDNSEKRATPDKPAGLPVTVPHDAINAVLDVWKPLKNERPPETPIEKFFVHVGPTMRSLFDAGWPLKMLYEKAKPSIPGVSFTVFRRHAEPHLEAKKKAPKAERRASKKTENAAAREAVREALDRVQDTPKPASQPVPPPMVQTAPEAVNTAPTAVAAAAVAPVAMPVDYRGSIVEISAEFDGVPPEIQGMERVDEHRLVGRGPGDNADGIRDALLSRAGARDVRIAIVQPAPQPAPEDEEFSIKFN